MDEKPYFICLVAHWFVKRLTALPVPIQEMIFAYADLPRRECLGLPDDESSEEEEEEPLTPSSLSPVDDSIAIGKRARVDDDFEALLPRTPQRRRLGSEGKGKERARTPEDDSDADDESELQTIHLRDERKLTRLRAPTSREDEWIAQKET